MLLECAEPSLTDIASRSEYIASKITTSASRKKRAKLAPSVGSWNVCSESVEYTTVRPSRSKRETYETHLWRWRLSVTRMPATACTRSGSRYTNSNGALNTEKFTGNDGGALRPPHAASQSTGAATTIT